MVSLQRNEVLFRPEELTHMFSIIVLSSLTLVYHIIGFRAFSMISFSRLAPYTFTQFLISLISDGLLYDVYPSVT